MTVLAVAPCGANAGPPEPSAAPAVGEDDALFRCKRRDAEVAITFKPELEVKELVAWVTGFTCKRFVLDPRVVFAGKKVTVIAPDTLSPREAYRVFLVALSTIDLTVVPKDGTLRVVDAGKARRDTVPLYQKGTPEVGEQVVRYLLRPTYAQPETLASAFALLKSDIGEVQQVGTMLMMTDYAGNVREMLGLAKLVDVPTGSDGIYTIPVQHADATKLAENIGGILGIAIGASAPPPPAAKGAAAAAPVPSKLLVDDRTNTLLLASSEAAYHRVQALVARLDIPLDIEGGASIHVYRLGSAIADELAKTLAEAIGTAPAGAKAGKAAGAAAPGASPADALGTALEGQVRVISDPPTNSLIVMSSGRDFLAIKEVIAQLDVPRRQVYIEALILEVRLDDGLEVGASAHGGLPIASSLLVGGVQAPTLKSLQPETLGAHNGLLGGLVSTGTKRVLGLSIPSYAILFQALADTSHVNVLSAPSLIALDNTEAKSKIGQNIPYKRGLSFGGLTGTEVPAGSVNTNIDRQDLLLELSVKPHISNDDTILLEVKQESKDHGGDDPELGPIWNTRSFETRVLVRDQHTIVLGGLMQERTELATSKVPLLGDLPLLGHFFKYTRKARRKSNLLLLLTPYIVKDQMELQELRERKLRDHDELVRSVRSLDRMKYLPKVDYRRKRGLVEEINRSLQAVEEDRAAREALRPRPAIPGGPVE